MAIPSSKIRPARVCRLGCRHQTPIKRDFLAAHLAGLVLASCFLGNLALPPASRAGDVTGQPSIRKSSRFVLIRRSVAQDQGAWVVTYQLRQTSPTGVILSRSEVSSVIEGWVSNSRVASHAVPRLSRVTVSGTSAATGTGEVIVSSDEAQRCRERAVISVWADDGPPPESDLASLVSLAPGAVVHLRLRLEHQHVLYGDYDPLLGVRSVVLNVGASVLRDQVALDNEHYLAQPKYSWPEPPDDRRDTHQFVSAPDSLHLEAHIPGHQYYRYPERPVRYGTKMRLRFWYLIAEGTEGECRARLAQYKDTPTSWRVLSEAGFEQVLETVGRWTKVERIVRADAEATTMALDFRILPESNIGEMWIDDVSLEPVGGSNCPDSP